MKNKLYNKYFDGGEYTNDSTIKYTSYSYSLDKRDKDVRYCIKMGVENKLPLQVITIITRLAEQDDLLWPGVVQLSLSKGRNENQNFCIFTFSDYDLAVEVCRILDVAGTGLFKFDLDKYNFPMQYKETDKTFYYDMNEEKHFNHNLDRKKFSATVGVYKLLRIVDAIMTAPYTTERWADENTEYLYATHDLEIDLIEIYDTDKKTYLGFESNFDVKSDTLKDKLISILEK